MLVGLAESEARRVFGVVSFTNTLIVSGALFTVPSLTTSWKVMVVLVFTWGAVKVG
jgi:hypothetical protein